MQKFSLFFSIPEMTRFFRSYTRMVALVLAIFAAGMISTHAIAAETVVVGGTGCATGGIRKVSVAYHKKHPSVEFKFLPSLGSGGGIKALLAGSLDISLSARQLKDDERAAGAEAREYARTPFVFITSEKDAPNGLTLKEIVPIYSGAVTKWPDGDPIRVVLRPESDTDTALLRSMSPDMNAAVASALTREGMLVAMTDQENADLLAKLKDGFGVGALSQIISEARPLHPVKLDNVVPSVKTLKDGSYPYKKSLYAITRKARPAVRAFVDFLASPEARAILIETGHLPQP
jgi:phosphate transport system substrate-binding protein